MSEETQEEQEGQPSPIINIPIEWPKSTSGTWPVVRPLTGRGFMEQLYREGKLLNLPKPQPLSSEERAERERLAKLFAGGKSMSEIINEGRGPY